MGEVWRLETCRVQFNSSTYNDTNEATVVYQLTRDVQLDHVA